MDEEIKNQIVKLLNNANEHVPAIVQELIDQKSGAHWVQVYVGYTFAILSVVIVYLITKSIISRLDKDDMHYDSNVIFTTVSAIFVGLTLFLLVQLMHQIVYHRLCIH